MTLATRTSSTCLLSMTASNSLPLKMPLCVVKVLCWGCQSLSMTDHSWLSFFFFHCCLQFSTNHRVSFPHQSVQLPVSLLCLPSYLPFLPRIGPCLKYTACNKSLCFQHYLARCRAPGNVLSCYKMFDISQCPLCPLILM